MNYFNIKFKAVPENEAFARMAISGFLLYLNPNFDEINDIKTAVSEAVTNAILYAYSDNNGEVEFSCKEENRNLHIIIKDRGIGIEDIEKAKEPFYTTDKNSERAGLGFAIMESFMDKLDVISEVGKGTEIIMYKKLK